MALLRREFARALRKAAECESDEIREWAVAMAAVFEAGVSE